MAHLLDFIQNHDAETVLTTLYVLVDDAYPLACAALGWQGRERGTEPQFTDSEVLTLVYYAELYHGGNETLGWSFIKNNFKALFPDLISRTRFNRRRRAVDFLIEPIRRIWLAWLHLDEDAERIIDSLPVHFCQYVRGKRCSLIHEQEDYGPDEFFGRVPSKKEQLCGVKWHISTTPWGVVDAHLPAPASYHDVTVAGAVLRLSGGQFVAGDKAYQSQRLTEEVKEQTGKDLCALRKKNQAPYGAWFTEKLKALRRRIECAFSVLAGRFGIEWPGGHSLESLLHRAKSKIAVHTVCFLLAALLD